MPFPAENLPALIQRILNEDPLPIPASYDPELTRIINWMLAKDPNERPLMREVMKDPFIVSCVRACKQRLGEFVHSCSRSEEAQQKLQRSTEKARRKQEKLASEMKQLAAVQEQELDAEQLEQIKKAQKAIRKKLADVEVKLFTYEQALTDVEANESKEIIGELDKYLAPVE